MVDIFDIAPSEISTRPGSSGFAYAGQGARLARYQHLVSKLNSSDEDIPAGGVKVDWLTEEEPAEGQGTETTTAVTSTQDDDGPFVGTFADAAAAMK